MKLSEEAVLSAKTAMQKEARRPSPRQFAGVAVLFLAIMASWFASTQHGHDFSFLYFAAIGIATGAPIYDRQWQITVFTEKCGGVPQGLFYSPATGFASLPFAAFPYRVAQFLFFLVLTAAVAIGVRALQRLCRPDASPGTWMLVAGLVLGSACVRWGMTLLQPAPMTLGLLCLFVVAIHTNRPVLAFFIASFVMAMKFTIALPFVGLLLLHRRYAAAAGSVAIGAALNVLGFMRVGGLTAFKEYHSAVVTLESIGTVNSPDAWDPQSSPRLDWVYLFHSLGVDIPLSRLAAILASALVSGWLFRESRRVERPVSLTTTAAFLAPLICVGVQSVYHHYYDISSMAAPLLVWWLLFPRARPRQDWAFWLMAPLVSMMALFPHAMAPRLAGYVFPGYGAGLMNLAFPVATSLALVGSLAVVRRTVRPFESGAETSIDVPRTQ